MRFNCGRLKGFPSQQFSLNLESKIKIFLLHGLPFLWINPFAGYSVFRVFIPNKLRNSHTLILAILIAWIKTVRKALSLERQECLVEFP